MKTKNLKTNIEIEDEKKQMKFKINYEPSKNDPGVACEDGKTHQEFKDECDINNILKKYAKTGILTNMIKQNPQYGDFSDIKDYQESLDIIQKAEEQFAALSSHVRKRFDNDPGKFLEFATDEKNIDEMRTLGLSKPDETKQNSQDKTQTKTKSEKTSGVDGA